MGEGERWRCWVNDKEMREVAGTSKRRQGNIWERLNPICGCYLSFINY